VDRGQLEQLRQPTVSAEGRRTPGLRLDDVRLLALLQALVAFARLIGRGVFRTGELLEDVRPDLDGPAPRPYLHHPGPCGQGPGEACPRSIPTA
jgi:hypothetical protein